MFRLNGLGRNFDSRLGWILIMGMMTPKGTGAVELHSIWKRWATAMLWMRGGSFKTAGLDNKGHYNVFPIGNVKQFGTS